MTNLEIATLLRKIAAAYQILDENRFKIIAYDRAGDSIEHLTSEAKDLWDNGKLGEIPGVGEGIAHYLDELFRTGRVKHFDDVMARVPEGVFPLLSVPGLGPKKAFKLVKELGLAHANDVVAGLEKAAKAGKIASIEGFGEKSQEDILSSIATYKRGQIKENRMELPIADGIAQEVMAHLKKHPSVVRVDVLGSLRRQVSTIGDIDIAAATKKPEDVVKHFLTYPCQKLVEQGQSGATILLHNGRQVDLRVQKPDAYGAMLQYFTGSKHHNIKLRTFALEEGLSLNEHGIKRIKTGSTQEYATEEAFYEAIKLPWIPPELREDKGEIEAAQAGKLPKLVEILDIKGDLHIHTSYNLESSHDLGVDSLGDHLTKAAELGYEYIGISDHNPSITNHTEDQIVDIMKRRKDKYEQLYSSWVQKVSKPKIFIMCEVDILPDGKLALPEKAFEYVDAVIVSVHSSFTQEKQHMTDRIVKAVNSYPKVRILGHPTGRLLLKREGLDADWGSVFAACKKQDVALEINAYPSRLDLPDDLVFDAVRLGLRFCINTDSHAVDQMELMKYGVAVARRGWAQTRDIVNTMGYNEFKKWLTKI
ncbi:MAG: hypothetical protein UU42_C0005G0025 [Candidatus Woesebacteria bacterium GW2011_GWA1_41_13b]|uniref:DNA-directed DNA polymerase n=1 Tax=Candidatus Woesebacteria bacterium GW2011_GWA1_41_13b TaxID=1618555 RepID=A0A0G0XVV1_9BACT|nr:MAG: hypothetical protein UU42_C0005G0025 [Candidatus Woesebacteria bacterium GW2011_GWA1_41_13b]